MYGTASHALGRKAPLYISHSLCSAALAQRDYLSRRHTAALTALLSHNGSFTFLNQTHAKCSQS